ncbi:hypothetical protein D3C71_931850 [compost metagenome]
MQGHIHTFLYNLTDLNWAFDALGEKTFFDELVEHFLTCEHRRTVGCLVCNYFEMLDIEFRASAEHLFGLECVVFKSLDCFLLRGISKHDFVFIILGTIWSQLMNHEHWTTVLCVLFDPYIQMLAIGGIRTQDITVGCFDCVFPALALKVNAGTSTAGFDLDGDIHSVQNNAIYNSTAFG